MCCATRAATSWPTMGGTPDRSNTILATGRLLRRFATPRSRRIGSRISGEIEKSAPADANGRPFAGNGKGPPGGPQNNLGPIFAIQTIPSYAQWVPSPTSCTCYRRTLAAAATSIQNDPGLAQGPAGPPVLGWGCRETGCTGSHGRHQAPRVHHAHRRRGGCVAARGTRTATRADAPDRRTDGLAGERSGSSVGARSVRQGAAEIGLGGRPQFADRYSLGEPRRSGVDASIREGTRRVTARPHSFAQHPGHCRTAAVN